MQNKVRIYQLARELDVETKDLLELCKRNGLDLKNQLTCVDADQRAQIEELVKRGGSSATATATATAAPPPPATRGPLPDVKRGVRVLEPTKAAPAPVTPHTATVTSKPAAPPVVAAEVAPPERAPATVTVPSIAPQPSSPPSVAAEMPPALEVPASVPVTIPEPAQPALPVVAAEVKPTEIPLPEPVKPTPAAIDKPAPVHVEKPRPAPVYHPRPIVADLKSRIQTITGKREGVRDLSKPAPSGAGARPGGPSTPGSGPPPRPTPPPSRGPTMAPMPTPRGPTPLKGPPKPAAPLGPKPLTTFTAAQLGQMTQKNADIKKIVQNLPAPETPVVAPVDGEDDEEKKKDPKKAAKPGGVGNRDQRRKLREARAQERKLTGDVATVQATLLDERPLGRQRGPIVKVRKGQAGKPIAKKEKAIIEPPITIRVLSEALGKKAGELLMKLSMQHGLKGITINSTVSEAMAEELAIEAGLFLEIKRPADADTDLQDKSAKPDNPEDLLPRAPVVTIMGHVDHGKTSLLDRIRQGYGIKSNVVSTEAGGITQVLRAWRVEKDGKPVTFLDTPGHEAFTKMRARGAQVTDIAVIVVAANDGVMPQTQEAINHARAAKVAIIVAINKVDLPDANLDKTRRQLYQLEILPDNMGGDIPFVETSAVSGKGIDNLLEAISIVAELRELKANPNKPGRGTCLEAMLTEGEGVRATLLVQDGTLKRGDVVVCGCSYGRVRQLYNDLGQHIESAGPSVPVRITGLDEVPNADDPFLVLDDLGVAQGIAEKRKVKRRVLATGPTRGAADPFTKMAEAKIDELKVILKADLRGSIEAIRKELEKLKHEEVAVRILHAAVGGITESDVQLALTSPEDTLILGFNTVPDERASALADERGISIRQYDIIYNLTNDVRAALEGKLKPRQEVVHLGRAVVREIFKISRVGTIAGCHVTQGNIKRNAKIRLIRDGVVIYPPVDRSASLESLKRFRDDIGEVREGFECGMKIAGYDDVKVGDVIEAYRVEEVQRSLGD